MSISRMFKIPDEEFVEHYNEALSVADLLSRIGFVRSGGSSNTLRKRLDSLDLSFEALRDRSPERYIESRGCYRRKRIPDDEIFVEHSTCDRKRIKELLIQSGDIPYVCSKCGISGIWQGEPLALQLDHINGVGDDNRISNLRFLCPNCHSQTETFGSRNRKIYAARGV